MAKKTYRRKKKPTDGRSAGTKNKPSGQATATLRRPVRRGDLPSDAEIEAEARKLAASEADEATNAENDGEKPLSLSKLQRMKLEELQSVAETEGVEEFSSLEKQGLVLAILKTRMAKRGLTIGEGVLEILPAGFGFLRSPGS